MRVFKGNTNICVYYKPKIFRVYYINLTAILADVFSGLKKKKSSRKRSEMDAASDNDDDALSPLTCGKSQSFSVRLDACTSSKRGL